MFRKIALLLIIFAIHANFQMFAQSGEIRQSMSYQQLWTLLQKNENSKNAKFFDTRFYLDTEDKKWLQYSETEEIFIWDPVKITLDECWISFTNCSFEKTPDGSAAQIFLPLNNIGDLLIDSSSIDCMLIFEGTETGFIRINNTGITDQIEIINNPREITFENCTIEDELYIDAENSDLKFINVRAPAKIRKNFELSITSKNLSFSNCYFQQSFIGLGDIFTNVAMKDSYFDRISFDYVTVQNLLEVDSVSFNSIGVNHFDFPTSNTEFPFYLVSGEKLALLASTPGEILKEPFKFDNSSNFDNDKSYRQLIASYNSFLNMYKSIGDRESFNNCYIELKDIETKKLDHEYRKSGEFEIYLGLMINKFLKSFSKYGTSPARSMLYSFWVIMLFAVIYFLFPSEEDNLTKQKLRRRLAKLINYFTTEKGLSEIEIEEKNNLFEEIESFKQSYISSKGNVPWLLSSLSRPIYLLSYSYLKFSLWFLGRIDISAGVWNDLKSSKKFWINLLVVFYFVIYGFWGLFVRLLNGLALSMNAFVTLGFGELQAVGISRYFAILEGLIGWFLLSIFSVSLISQVLQI